MKSHAISIYIIIFFSMILSTFFSYKSVQISIPYERNFVVLNLESEPLNVTAGDKAYELQMFDVAKFSKTTKVEDTDFRINQNDKTLIQRSISRDVIGDTLEIIILADAEFCFFQADVTDFYYSTNFNAVKGLVSLTNTENNSYKRILSNTALYVYPGNASKDNLPEFILDDRIVIGIYPIECNLINNSGVLLETIKFYQNYNSETLRENFQRRQNEIENLTL